MQVHGKRRKQEGQVSKGGKPATARASGQPQEAASDCPMRNNAGNHRYRWFGVRVRFPLAWVWHSDDDLIYRAYRYYDDGIGGETLPKLPVETVNILGEDGKYHEDVDQSTYREVSIKEYEEYILFGVNCLISKAIEQIMKEALEEAVESYQPP